MRADRLASRRAFTLVELLFALTLGAAVCLGARLLLDALIQAREHLMSETLRADRAANGERLLRAIVANARADADSISRFEGDGWSARFASWCPVPAGWLERCVACLILRPSGDESTVMVSLNCAEWLSVRRQRGSAALRYLDTAESDSRWLETWSSRMGVPAAVGIVGRADTLVLPVGGG